MVRTFSSVNLGRLLEGEQAGSEAGKAFYNEQIGRVESIQQKVEAYVRGGGKQLSAVYLRMLDFTVATGDTFEGAMLEAVGFENVAGAYGGWVFIPFYGQVNLPWFVYIPFGLSLIHI